MAEYFELFPREPASSVSQIMLILALKGNFDPSFVEESTNRCSVYMLLSLSLVSWAVVCPLVENTFRVMKASPITAVAFITAISLPLLSILFVVVIFSSIIASISLRDGEKFQLKVEKFRKFLGSADPKVEA